MKDIDEANTEANSRKHHPFLNTFLQSRASQQTRERQDALLRNPASKSSVDEAGRALVLVQGCSDVSRNAQTRVRPARLRLQATGGNDAPTDPGMRLRAPSLSRGNSRGGAAASSRVLYNRRSPPGLAISAFLDENQTPRAVTPCPLSLDKVEVHCL